MRILIIVGSLTGGGAERAASLWANGFAERGYEVGVALGCKKGTPSTYPLNSSVRLYNIWSFWGSAFSRKMNVECFRVPKIKKVLKDFQPDVVIGVMRPWAECARRAAKGMNIKIINTEHNNFDPPVDKPMKRADRISKFIWNKHFDKVTVLTYADKRTVDGILENVEVLPDPLAFKPRVDFERKEKMILAAGRLGAWHCKGFDLLIKAWGDIANKYPDWKLVIAGTGNDESKKHLEQLADDNHLYRQIEFPGYVDLLPYYQRASIFVLSSRYEAFGMVMIEAMSQGCACVACDYKGRQREIITSEKEGLICPVDDDMAIAQAIGRLIDEKSLRKEIQDNAVKRSDEYSLDIIMDKWDEILKSVMVNE